MAPALNIYRETRHAYFKHRCKYLAQMLVPFWTTAALVGERFVWGW